MLTARAWQASALAALLAIGVAAPAGAQAIGDPGDLGGELWAWGWAGYQSQNLVLERNKKGPIIMQMTDLSGRGNHFYAHPMSPPAYSADLKVPTSAKGGPYETPLPVVGLDSYADGGYVYGNVFTQDQSLNAAGGFYLAAACMNTRYSGTRELFGTTASDSVSIDQGLDSVHIALGGQWLRLCPDGALPSGPLVLEIWRDASGALTCYANGNNITKTPVSSNNVCNISGVGFDGTGSSQWDDYWMEFVMCDSLPPQNERDMVREYLRAKWNVWGSAPAPKAVITPTTGSELTEPMPFNVNMSDPNGDLAWVAVHVMVNGDPQTRVRLPFSYFTLQARPDGSKDLTYLFDLPASGYTELKIETLLIDKTWNMTQTAATYLPGR